MAEQDDGAGFQRSFGRQVKLLRERGGLTRAQLGARLGYGEDQIASVELGRRIPRPELIEKADRELNAGGVLIAMKDEVARARYPAFFRDAAKLEAEAVELQSYDIHVAKGLLQTEEYAAVTSAFYDPYVLRGPEAFTSYVSSWTDSGVNQLSMLTRFVDLTELTSLRQTDGGASAWCTVGFRSRDEAGSARLLSSWLTGSSSKESSLVLGHSGVEVWIDHTAMTGFAAREGELLAAFGNDGRTARKVAHYRPLYASLLSDRPDPVLGFDAAATIMAIHLAAPEAR
ncbi:Scr1 family TA system antitoxin-like transcriptional regulator [Kitasatospora sp. NPDC001159]